MTKTLKLGNNEISVEQEELDTFCTGILEFLNSDFIRTNDVVVVAVGRHNKWKAKLGGVSVIFGRKDESDLREMISEFQN